MKKYHVIVSAAVLLIGVAFFLSVSILNDYATLPAFPEAATRRFTVRSGQNVSDIARVLARESIISHPFKFRLLARINGSDRKIKAGEYRISGAMSPADILKRFVVGKVILYRLTVPEGHTLLQIAEMIEKTDFANAADFRKFASNARLAERYGLEGHGLEGYLYPDTYFFPKDVTSEKIIDTMVAGFWSVFAPDWQVRAESMGFSVHQIVTLAAIIEKETGDPAERPIISSVFHNRLARGMRLASDPTVIYGIKDFDGNLTRKHLTTPTPYNTYQMKGLPPGPIANPGKEAIRAALFPAETEFLYFVARRDRTHQFSTNIKDHNRAVRKYQLRR
ncbi:MAG: endolytic transglycosylase MltG [Deltaproteobacteria bacterium]|nr:endolytic transglycosylase MltG [Deltaproteobacteria bacterium]